MKLDNSNFILYCAQHYDNPPCTGTEEFLEDLKRVKYIKKLITRYVKSGDLKERLILNHLIILNNVFGAFHLPRILYLKMGDQMKYVKPFLILLGIMPDEIRNVGKEEIVYTDDIPLDNGIVEALRKL
jgi:hypothetical protein